MSEENKGFGAANNQAIKHANAKYVFLLNTDTLLINNAVKILLSENFNCEFFIFGCFASARVLYSL